MKFSQWLKKPFRLTILLTAFAALYCLTLYSCKPKNKPENKGISLIQLLLGNGTNSFRNVNLGDDMNAVMKSEKKSADEKDSDYVFYTLPMDTLYPDSVNAEVDTLNFYTIAYNFNAQKLNEIDEYVYLATDSMAAHLYTRLSEYLTNKYGDGQEGSDSKVWNYKKNGKKASVSLSDESAEYDFGKLSLVYYTED